MQPMDTAHTTRIFSPPEGHNEEANGKAVPLPVVDEYGAGLHVITSFWHCSLRERLQVLFGKPVAVTLHCATPPAMLVYAARIKRKHYTRSKWGNRA